MTDLLSLVMLVCASFAALAFGIFTGYAILRAGFFLMRPAPRPAVKATPSMIRTLP